MRNAVALALGMLVAVGCSAPRLESPAAAAASLRAADEAFARAVLAGDTRAFADIVAQDAVFHGASVLRGRAAVVEAWAPLLAPDRDTLLSWTPEEVEVAASGDLGYTRGPYRLERRGEDGNPSVLGGSYVTVWRRGGDGVWRAVLDIGTEPRPLQ